MVAEQSSGYAGELLLPMLRELVTQGSTNAMTSGAGRKVTAPRDPLASPCKARVCTCLHAHTLMQSM